MNCNSALCCSKVLLQPGKRLVPITQTIVYRGQMLTDSLTSGIAFFEFPQDFKRLTSPARQRINVAHAAELWA